MSAIASPTDLNGSLLAILLPLRTTFIPGPSVTAEPGEGYEIGSSPFLWARAPRTGTAEAVLQEVAPQFHSWETPVLLTATQTATSDHAVTFGRSVATLGEESECDQPLTMSESCSASLWVVPGSGLVLVLEALSADLDVAARANSLGRLLHVPAVAGGSMDRPGIEVLLERMGVKDSSTLADVFGAGIAQVVGSAVDAHAPLSDHLIPRDTVVSGNRLIEGMIVGLAAGRREDLGIAELLSSSTRDDDSFEAQSAWQEEGYRWAFSPIAIADEPADEEAVSIARSDGRVTVIELDSMSIYHDYLGLGGAGSVLELVPLTALLGLVAADHADVRDVLRGLAADGNRDDTAALEQGLRVARRVRARLQLRRLEQAQLSNEQNFRAWSVDEAVRREVAPLALGLGSGGSSGIRGADVISLIDSVESMEASLVRLQDEKRLKTDRADEASRREAEEARRRTERAEEASRRAAEEREQRMQRTLEAGLGVLSAAGVVGLFAALASVPEDGRLIPTLATAGLYTILSLLLIGGLVLGGVLAARRPRRRSRRLERVAAALFMGSAAAAVLGVSVGESGRLIWCIAAAGLLVAACGVLLRIIHQDPEPGPGSNPTP